MDRNTFIAECSMRMACVSVNGNTMKYSDVVYHARCLADNLEEMGVAPWQDHVRSNQFPQDNK